MLSILVLTLAMEVTANHAIRRGDTLTAEDLSGPDGEVSALLGKQARRPLMRGRQVRPADVQEPVAVVRQSAVTILFVRGSLTLRTEGRALKEGRVGDVVDILLPGRRKPVMGIVVGPGQVEIAA